MDNKEIRQISIFASNYKILPKFQEFYWPNRQTFLLAIFVQRKNVNGWKD